MCKQCGAELGGLRGIDVEISGNYGVYQCIGCGCVHWFVPANIETYKIYTAESFEALNDAVEVQVQKGCDVWG